MNLIERLNKAIDVEYDSKNDELDELMLLPPEERVQKGDTISNITATFIPMMESNGRILFTQVNITCKDNISKFREGSPVVLSGHGESFSLNVVEDEGETMSLEIGWNSGSVSSSLNNKSGWFLDPDKVDIRHIVKKSTGILSYDSAKYKLLNGIFEGTILPKISSEQLKKGKQLAEQTKLNPTQREAFANAYATENYFLIQGPPGTGKTWLLAHLALQFAKEGMKVLVAASTHTAINNALQKASTISSSANIIKVG